MEFLLLWADELDDLWGVVRHVAPAILSFLAACLLFAATGMALIRAPHVALFGFVILLSGSLFELVRRRRLHLLDDHVH